MTPRVYHIHVTKHHFNELIPGTFRPDRIKSIAERFGVDGNMALENILYARAFNSEHQVCSWVRVKGSLTAALQDGVDQRVLDAFR